MAGIHICLQARYAVRGFVRNSTLRFTLEFTAEKLHSAALSVTMCSRQKAISRYNINELIECS